MVALAAGLVLGAASELTVVRPTVGKPPLNSVIVTIGLLIFLEGLAGIFFGGQYRSFPAAFSITGLKVGGTPLGMSRIDVFTAAAVLAAALILAVLFRYTTAGLRMRAAAFNATVARLSGVRVGAGADPRLGAGRADRRAGRRARHAVHVPVPEQHGLDLRARLHRRGDRRAGQPGRARWSAGCCSASRSATSAATWAPTWCRWSAWACWSSVLMIRPSGLFAGARMRRV